MYRRNWKERPQLLTDLVEIGHGKYARVATPVVYARDTIEKRLLPAQTLSRQPIRKARGIRIASISALPAELSSRFCLAAPPFATTAASSAASLAEARVIPAGQSLKPTGWAGFNSSSMRSYGVARKSTGVSAIVHAMRLWSRLTR